jgi:hypothetical protein
VGRADKTTPEAGCLEHVILAFRYEVVSWEIDYGERN